jgi:hypothetical protein
MALSKIVKIAWKWWQGKSKGTRLLVYVLLAWEALMGLYFFLK